MQKTRKTAKNRHFFQKNTKKQSVFLGKNPVFPIIKGFCRQNPEIPKTPKTAKTGDIMVLLTNSFFMCAKKTRFAHFLFFQKKHKKKRVFRVFLLFLCRKLTRNCPLISKNTKNTRKTLKNDLF